MLLREGPLVKRCRSKDVRYTFFLFNDMLLYASTRFGKYNVHRRLPLAKLRVVDVAEAVKPRLQRQRHRADLVEAGGRSEDQRLHRL